MAGKLIIIASDSDSCAVEFANKAVDVLKNLLKKGSMFVINAQEIFDNFISDGYVDPSSEEAAKAYLKLRESFSHHGASNPALVRVGKVLDQIVPKLKKEDVVIVTDVRDVHLVQMLEDKYRFDHLYFLDTDDTVRHREFQRKFRVPDKLDIPKYLHNFVCTDSDHYDAAQRIVIATEEDLDLEVMDFVKKILPRPAQRA